MSGKREVMGSIPGRDIPKSLKMLLAVLIISWRFAQKGKQIEAIHPTEAVLLQHTKRAIYQGALIWEKPDFPSHADVGWI